MSTDQAENADDESIKPEDLAWIEEQKVRIKNHSPESLHEQLNRDLESIKEATSAEDRIAKMRELESSIEQAQKIHTLLGHFEDELAKAAQSNATVETEVELFWAKYADKVLDPLQYKTLEGYLKEQFQKHAKETQVVNDTSQKFAEAMEAVDAEVKEYLTFFNDKERDKIYAERSKIEDPKALDRYKQKILRLKMKREATLNQTLESIDNNLVEPEKGWILLQKLEKKYGKGINQLTAVERTKAKLNDAEDAAKKASEALSKLTEVHNEAHQANADFKATTGEDHPDYLKVILDKKTEADNHTAEQEETVTESYESAESKIKLVESLRAEAKNSAKYWGERGNDRQHAIRGVGGTMGLLAAGAMEGYSLENYQDEIKRVGHLVPHSVKFSKTDGRKIPEISYDLPSDADAFSADKASGIASKLKGAANLSEHGRAAASLFYNDYYKANDPNLPAPSIFEFISSCNNMIHQLKAGKKTEKVLEAA